MTAKGEFQGFPKEMFEFFMAISFNNNTEFFEENRKLYEQKVKAPLYALARDLTPMALHVDPEMEVRPSKVVSRLRRDTRFSANKLPFRDHMWLSWRPAGRPKSQCFGLYLEIGLEGLRYGVGWYDADPRRAKAIRRLLRQQKERFLPIATDPALAQAFQLHASWYKRLQAPEDLPEALLPYYRAKGFYLEHAEPLDKRHLQADFLWEVEANLLRLKAIYGFFRDLSLEGIDEEIW